MQDSLIFTDEYASVRASCIKAIRSTRKASYWYGGIFLALALLCVGIMCYVGYEEGGAIAGWAFGINGLVFVGLGLLSHRSPRIAFWLGFVASVLFFAAEVGAMVTPDDSETRVILGIFALLQIVLIVFLTRGLVFASRLRNLPIVVAV